ncbi:MAG: Zn-ribbon domain-containing OB-fold protein [Anaerolineales bacterium]|jgi:uncharacterized OB-fold protein
MSETDFTSATFNQYLSQHKLMGSRCQSCGALHLPPRPLCPACYGEQLEWEQMPTEGKLMAFTTIHIAPTAMLDAGYGRDNPYCSGVVKLDGGPSISAQILGVDSQRPEEINIGTPVTVEYVERELAGEKKTYLAFRVKA